MENYNYITGEINKINSMWYREFVFVNVDTMEMFKGNVVNKIDQDHREEDAIGIELTYSDQQDHDGVMYMDDEIHEWIVEQEIENLNHCDYLQLEKVKMIKNVVMGSLYNVHTNCQLKEFVNDLQNMIKEELD